MTDWTKPFWIESPWMLRDARRREEKGEGAVAFDEDEGPARWLPWPKVRKSGEEPDASTSQSM